MNRCAMATDASQASTGICADLDRETRLDDGEQALERSTLSGQHHPIVVAHELVRSHGVSVIRPQPVNWARRR